MSQSCSLPFANHMMVVNYNVPMLLPPFKKSLQIVTNCYKFLTIFLAFSIPSLKEFHGLFYLDYISHFLDNLFCDAKSKPPHQSHTTRYFLSLIYLTVGGCLFHLLLKSILLIIGFLLPFRRSWNTFDHLEMENSRNCRN